MNNTRRKQIGELLEKLEEVRGGLEILRDEEQEYVDNIPENLQSGERYEKAEEAAYVLDEAVCDLESMVLRLEDAIEPC